MDEFKIDVINDILIFKVDVIIATHRDAKPMWEEFESHLLFNHKKIIIDISSCNTVDSTFIGMIIKIFRKVNEKNGQLKLIYPQVPSDIFQLTGVSKIIDCYDNPDNAIKSFD
jgi:anti-anti-sigma regulatory factor